MSKFIIDDMQQALAIKNAFEHCNNCNDCVLNTPAGWYCSYQYDCAIKFIKKEENMKRYNILNCVSGEIIKDMRFAPLAITARNGKQALKNFVRFYAMNTGMYEYTKDKNSVWNCLTTYGAHFQAIKIQ